MSDDLISRQELLESIEKVSVKGNVLDDDWVYRFVQEFPSIDAVERKNGKWIDNIFCSECGWVNQVESGFIGTVKGFNFCPNCGADMRGEQHEAD